MPQMYKVFVNDSLIILTDSLPKENKLPVYLFESLCIENFLQQIIANPAIEVFLLCADLEKSSALFFENFKMVTAAGGLVLNPQKEILFIYRNGIWDLPKGMIEKGETLETTALREVVEECGIENLSIDQFLTTTYHYFYRNEKCLKKTHWFLMHSNFEGVLQPQEEEGITEVVFKNKKATLKALQNSYTNIKLVYNKYLDLQGYN
ncbi:NUDIX domain-containing protein [Polaribacter sp.]|nr:NUDIX domain-containing protein [Polaribacter sp.]|tara:strand:- start:336 stop:953 length:618 start_codon:yes stop_codon:yes gene_type:complete